MRQFLSNISSQIYSRKKLILGGLAIALLFSFVPLHIAHAGLLDIFVNALVTFFTSQITVILIPIALIVEGIFKALLALLTLVIAGLGAMTVIPGLPNTPTFVLKGWETMQGLANITFILILTFIGLATILRLQTYQLQKTLPRLIVIALLVNFSGVFVGFFADIGNILTKFFIAGDLFSGDLWGFSFSISLAGNVTKILFYFVAILVLFVIFLLFIVRMVILWILTILAPLAFVACILPSTQKYWTQWFQALIQWSFFTVPVAFFMYLARLVLSGMGISLDSLGFFAGIFPYLTALILLFLGITLSMQMAPAGAQGVINFAKKLPKRITETRLGAKAAAWGASKTQGALSGLSKLSEAKGVGGLFARPLGWAAKGTSRLAGGKLLEYAASKRRMTLPKNFDQMSEPELEEWAKANHLSNEDTVQLAARMQDKKKYKHTTKSFKGKVNAAAEKVSGQRWLHPELGALKDAMPETVTKNLMLNLAVLEASPEKRDEVKQSIQKNIDKVLKEIEDEIKTSPALQNEVSVWLRDNPGRTMEDLATAKIYAQELKPQDIPGVIRPKTLPFRLAMRDSNPASLQRLQDNFDHETLEDMFRGVGGFDVASNTPEKLEALAKRNPRLVRALFTNPVLQGMAWEGRNQMRDSNDRVTTNFEVFERKMRVKQLIEQRPTKKLMLEQGAKLMQDMRGAQNKLAEARRAGISPVEIKDIQTQMQDVEDRFAVFKETVIEKDTDLKVVWDQIEGLISGTQQQQGTVRGGRRRRRGT